MADSSGTHFPLEFACDLQRTITQRTFRVVTIECSHGPQLAYNRLMLELRQELVALIEWEYADFGCITQTEIDAVAHRITRMAELLARMSDIAELN